MCDHFVTARPVEVDSRTVRQEDPWLARHVGTHVPRVSSGEEGDIGAVVDMLSPPCFGSLRRLDDGETPCAQVTEAVEHPVNVLFD